MTKAPALRSADGSASFWTPAPKTPPPLVARGYSRLASVRLQFQRALRRRDKREALKLLRIEEMSRIELGPARLVHHEQAVRDAKREPCIYLNRVRFSGPEGIVFDTLKRVVCHLGALPELCDSLLCRAARTSAGADSYFVLQHLLGLDTAVDPTYVVMPKHYGTFDCAHTFSEESDDESGGQYPPRALDISLSRTPLDQIHVTIVSQNGYSLHRLLDESASQVSERDTEIITPDLSPASRSEWIAIYTSLKEDLTIPLRDTVPISESRFLSISPNPHRFAPRPPRRFTQARRPLVSCLPSAEASAADGILERPFLQRAHIIG